MSICPLLRIPVSSCSGNAESVRINKLNGLYGLSLRSKYEDVLFENKYFSNISAKDRKLRKVRVRGSANETRPVWGAECDCLTIT